MSRPLCSIILVYHHLWCLFLHPCSHSEKHLCISLLPSRQNFHKHQKSAATAGAEAHIRLTLSVIYLFFFINESVWEQKAGADTYTICIEEHIVPGLHSTFCALALIDVSTWLCWVEVTDSAGFIHQLRPNTKIQGCVTVTLPRPPNAIMPSTGPWGQTWQLGQWPHIHQ